MSRPEWRQVGDKRWLVECSGLAEFLNPGPRAVEFDRSESGAHAFTGTATYAEAEAVMRDGWPDGAERARALAASLSAEATGSDATQRPAPTWDVAGDDADVERFLAGDPESMIAWQPETVPAAGRVVRVVLDGSVNCDVGAEYLRVAGVMTAAAVDVLEARGVRCEVWVSYSSNFRDKEIVEIRHRLKAAEEPLDLPRVVAGMHPSAFRRIGFRWMETRAACPGGYGWNAEASRAEGDLLFPAGQISRIVESGRAEWLRKQAETVLGVTA